MRELVYEKVAFSCKTSKIILPVVIYVDYSNMNADNQKIYCMDIVFSFNIELESRRPPDL